MSEQLVVIRKSAISINATSSSGATVNHLKTILMKYEDRMMMTGDATRFQVYVNPFTEAKNS